LGQHGDFSWIDSSPDLKSLAKRIVRLHPGLRLCITAFDSGPIRLGPEDEAEGWTARGKVMVSPPLAEGLAIPTSEYDEWYLLDEPPSPDWEPEVFVNYGSFTLVPVEELYKTWDPTWDRHGLDWLVPIQERFWDQMERVNPVTYVARGDHDIVVSRRRELIERLRTDS
jgi:hypothetical protein